MMFLFSAWAVVLPFYLPTAFGLVIFPDAEVFQPSRSAESLRPLPKEFDVWQGSDASSDDTPLPVVIWHGLGDAYDSDGMSGVADVINAIHPGTYVRHIALADNGGSDRQASWFGNLTTQVDLVCEQLASDQILNTAPAVDAIGFSQGGQFLRGWIERCGHRGVKVRHLITFGSQHNGIAEFQKCKGATDFICNGANLLLKGNAVWSDFVQNKLVPAQYYRDPADYENYLEHSNFLADINNERTEKNALYAENLAAIEKFVMILFEKDKAVIPKESGWFAAVDAASGTVTQLQNREIYKQDWIGLKALDKRGGLVFEQVPGEHMQLDEKDLKKLFKTYLGPAAQSDARVQPCHEGHRDIEPVTHPGHHQGKSVFHLPPAWQDKPVGSWLRSALEVWLGALY